MIGPSYLLRKILPNNLILICSGILLTGFGGAFTSIGAYQEMLQPYKQKIFALKDYDIDEDDLTDHLSGLYNAGLSLGTIIGPMLGSYIMIAFNSFRISSDFFALLTFAFAIMMIFVVELPRRYG